MSRQGPGYITTETEMLADVDRKRDAGEITDEAARQFIELHEFAKEIGDTVDVTGVKNARIKLVVEAHQGTSGRNPGVFTANVNGELKIWPAKMPIDYGYLDLVPWEEDAYRSYERAFQSLYGLPRDTDQIRFDEFAAKDLTAAFTDIVADFVTACRTAEH
ncbi:hypothetical protein NDI56_16845 [Haloarcula sp. S1CR25-12]|uniref:Uncharacterized protein n=1 Tax=Haloarcula saliterrae TaxID=2950534 RepID=A0ABU2FFN7_9EURY|nr:hypothetical protein [Haloarcula sp. S1CR25-12]MDS0261068.1 hypothetical protein [Haloarcula sp. S1CR25-12]